MWILYGQIFVEIVLRKREIKFLVLYNDYLYVCYMYGLVVIELCMLYVTKFT